MKENIGARSVESLAGYAGEVCGAAQRQSQTREQITSLFSVIESTAELVVGVRARLESITMKNKSAKEISKDLPEIQLVPLADEIRTARKQIQDINDNISELLQEIEL